MKEKEPIELTREPNSSNLKREGDIFMPEPGNGEIPVDGQSSQTKPTLSDEQKAAREALGKLNVPQKGASIDELSSYRIFREVLSEKAGFSEEELKAQQPQIRIGPSNWKNKENDIPVNVTGYKGKGPDGRDYVSVEGSETGIPFDEIEPILTEREKEIGDIIEKSDDFYQAFEKIIKTASPEAAKDIIDNMGELFVSTFASGLSRTIYEKHMESFKKLKGTIPEEARERLSDVVKNIRDDRHTEKLEDPLTEASPKVVLSDEDRHSQEQLQKEREEDEEKKNQKKQAKPSASGDEEENDTESENNTNSDEENERKMIQNLLQLTATEINKLEVTEDQAEGFAQLEAVRSGFGELLVLGYGLNTKDSSKFAKNKQKLEKILKKCDITKQKSINETQEKLNALLGKTLKAINNSNAKIAMSENPYGRIKSVQELSKWIIENQDSKLWGKSGVYPLLDENDNFSQANFLIWLREESVKHHENNPNSEMTPLSSVGISTDYRDISVYAMSLLREQYMKDKTQNGKVMIKLAEQMINEGFLFGEFRTMALIYSQGMGDDKNIDKMLQQIHAKNTLTRPGNLRVLMKMSEEFTENEALRDTRVGDAFRIAADIYNNISDKESLEEILGKGDIKVSDFKDVFRILNGLKDWEDIPDDKADYGDFHYYKSEDGREGFRYKDEKGFVIELFNEDGTADMNQFVKAMNIFNTPSEDATKIELLREFVRLKSAKKAGLKIAGMAFSQEDKLLQKTEYVKKVKAYIDSGKTQKEAEDKAGEEFMLDRYGHRSNIKFAEVMAYSMQRPYGSASKQDHGYAGYDAMTKTQTEGYLGKQSGTERGGSTGLPEQIGLFKDLSPDPLTGIRTESGRTISEIMRDLRKLDNQQDLNNEDIKRAKDLLFDELKFKENAERNYTTNQQIRALQILHLLSDGKVLDISKIVTQSYLEGPKFNAGEFQEQINEGIIKPFRYAFINSGINFGEEVRMYIKDNDDTGHFITTNKARKTLGDELYRKFEQDYYEQEDKDGMLLKEKYPDNPNEPGSGFAKFLSTRDANVRVAKDSSLGIFAGQLRSHRKFGALGQSWSYGRTEMFIDSLKTIMAYKKNEATGRYEPEYDENGNPKRYYNDRDIKWLRKNSGTEIWRMLAWDMTKEGVPALASGSWEGLMIFIKSLAK